MIINDITFEDMALANKTAVWHWAMEVPMTNLEFGALAWMIMTGILLGYRLRIPMYWRFNEIRNSGLLFIRQREMDFCVLTAEA